MSSVDTRVVQMQFDNKQFEKNISTTMSSLKNLEAGLKFDGATKGLEELNKASRRSALDFEDVENTACRAGFSIRDVWLKISTVFEYQIARRITNAMTNVAKAFTIDPIKTGLAEYETQINAVQTILANTESKGTTLEQVNEALDTLNTYADKTIYNFTEMTRNIGTFTAAGVDLDTSVNAIQGIANLAAVSGSTSQQASTAMYQLSQALSSGTVKLQDWNSVVNAGMGGQVFQDALKETARVHGVNIDEMIEKEGSFRETLKNGWLSSEILTDTLSKFTMAAKEGSKEWEEYKKSLKEKGYTDEQADAILKMANTATDAATKVKTFTQLMDTLKEAAQSGWTQSWEIVVGDFEEAKALWTDVSNVLNDVIGASANARNDMLKTWKDLGGRKALIDAFKEAFHGVVNIIKPIKEAFREFFPRTTGQQLYDITAGFKAMTENFKKWTENSDNIDRIKRSFRGLFAALDIGKQLLGAVFRVFKTVLGITGNAGDGFLSVTAAIGDFIVSLNNAIKTGGVFNVIADKISKVLSFIFGGVKNFVNGIASVLNSIAKVDTSGVDEFTDKLKARFKPLTMLGEGLKKFFGFLVGLLKKIAPVFFEMASNIGKAVREGDYKAIIDLINGLLTGGLILGVKQIVSSLVDITSMFDGLKDCLSAWQSSLNAKTLLRIAAAVAVLVASLVILSLVDSEKILASMGAITGLFIDLFASMAIFSKITKGKGFNGATKVTAAMLGMSAAILILSFAMTRLAKLDLAGIGKGLLGVLGLVTILTASAIIMNKSTKKFKKSAGGMIALSVAVLILAKAVEKLGVMNLGDLAKGLGAVGILCTELALFMKATDLNKMGLAKGIGLMFLATAVNILSKAVSRFGSLDIGSLSKGLAAVGVVLAELAIFMKFTGNAKKVMTTATGLTILAAAMVIFAKAVGNMGSLSLEQIGKGLLGMAVALTAVCLALRFMPNPVKTLGCATALVLIASAMVIFAKAVGNMGSLGLEQIGIGLLGMAAALTAVCLALRLMPNPVKTLASAAALLVTSTALVIFAKALKTIGSMSLEEIAKGLGALVVALVILGVASYALSAVAPTMLLIGAAIALIGVGCAAAGAGLLAFSAGLTALAAAGAGAASAIVLIVMGLIGLIPAFLEAVGEGIVALCGVLAGAGDAICDALATIIVAILEALTRAIPSLLTCLGALLDALISFILQYVPKLIDAGLKIIEALLKGIADHIPEIVRLAVLIMTNFLKALGKELPKVVDAGFEMVITFIEGVTKTIRQNIERLRKACRELGVAILDGLTGGLASKVRAVVDYIKGIGKKILDGIKKVLGIHSPSTKFAEIGKNTLQGFINGFKTKVSSGYTTVKNFASKCFTNIKSGVSGFATAGKNAIAGFITGIKSKLSNAANAAWEVGKKALSSIKNALGIHSPSKEFAEVGMYSDEGLAGGLKKFAKVVGTSAANVGKTAIESLKEPMSNIPDVLNSDIDNDLTIRPVLDLSQVEADSSRLGGMFGRQTVDIAGVNAGIIGGNMNVLADIAARMQAINDAGNSDIVDAIVSLKQDFFALSEAVGRMQVVMDSGILVGQIATQMDGALGQITIHKGRGN